jgi:hypothetical protein
MPKWLSLPQDPDVLIVESTEERPHLDTPVAVNCNSIGRILP